MPEVALAAKPSLRPTLAVFASLLLANGGGAMQNSTLIGMVGVAMGLVLGLGWGVGLGASLNAVGALSTPHTNHAGVGVFSARERFVQCSTSDAENIPGPEELEAMLAWRQGRYAEPKWGTP